MMNNTSVDLNKYRFAVPLDSYTPISEEEFKHFVPNPAKTFPFELDVFQKQAIIHIEKGENVFVAAHTSAGKTVLAEYAISLGLANNRRVIYTSPIKALSNQKFRDLKQEFKNVGIITGDVQLNPEAPCLIMTTEILLQMLYANSEVINDLEFVIFDECHYVNDEKRGHVWEEVFILLPEFVKLVLLSATVPNVIQFSDWLGRTRQKKTYVVSTNKRPVPLKHYVYLGRDGKTQNQQFLILEGEGQINKANFDEAVEIMKERKEKYGFIKRNSQSERNIYLNLIRHLKSSEKLPVICFTLSRRKCDQNLAMLLSIKEENFRLTTKSESYHIRRFVRKHLKHLKESDLKLEQVLKVSTMLERGFGVHHSGVLPILKELTEILFSSGLVKVLFATETFAMGVNMPARTVVFDSLDKHDGYQLRLLKPAEYIQMAGRAGRRGKDPDGTVIILCKYSMRSMVEFNLVMKGSAEHLESQFRLTYHMILNMLKTKTASIENFLGSSYREHKKLLSTTNVDSKLKNLATELEQIPLLVCDYCGKDLVKWNQDYLQYVQCKDEVMPLFLSRALDKKLLNSGRLLVFGQDGDHFKLGLVLKTIRGKNSSIGEILILTSENKNNYEVKTITTEQVHCLLNKQIKGIDTNSVLQENESKSSLGKNRKFATEDSGQKLDAQGVPEGIHLLTYSVKNMITYDKIGKGNMSNMDTVYKMQDYVRMFTNLGALSFDCLKCGSFSEHYRLVKDRYEVETKISQLKYKMSTESLELLPEYKQRIQVLQLLNFLDDHLVLLPKGQIASCISDNELLITEIVFENLLGTLSDEAIPAVLSCFVFEKQSNADKDFQSDVPELDEIIKKIETICLNFGEIEQSLQVEYSSTHFLETLNFDTVIPIYHWAKGESFLEIMTYTELQEGIMVRCIQRTDELIKNIRIAAKNLESMEFEAKLERASKLIRRDIVFCPSLYTQEQAIAVDSEEAASEPQMDFDPTTVPQTTTTAAAADDDQNENFLDSNEFFSYNFNETDDELLNSEVISEEQFSSNFI